ncbi:MAG: hypothetical protein ABIK15_13610 [Pseudomonadota bacterium]
MKSLTLLLSLIVIQFFTIGLITTAHSAGIDPVVAEFNGSLAVKLEIGTASVDASWMSLILDNPIDPSEYPFLSVTFDIYRSSDSGTTNEWLPWSFQGANFTPFYGGQLGDTTYPFVGGGDTGTAPTVKDTYATVDLSWAFAYNTCSSYYNGNNIDSEVSITIDPPDDPDPFTGFSIRLSNVGLADGEVVWIDNFLLAASGFDEILHPYDFGELTPGALHGQGVEGSSHWEAGTNTVVPIPGSVWLMGSMLIGFIGIRMRKKR